MAAEKRRNREALSGANHHAQGVQRAATGAECLATPLETSMLTHASVTTMLPVKDLARARRFYEDSLGLTPIGLKPDGKFVYDCSGATLALFPKEGGTKADHTAISFRVPDIAASIAELKRHGVVFEDYDFPGLKTVEHVCVLGAEKAAWFLDTEGNILCLHEDLT
jgi:catechol 2,3-dioxygenase-like lactoylglutathione lyase family enzyme